MPRICAHGICDTKGDKLHTSSPSMFATKPRNHLLGIPSIWKLGTYTTVITTNSRKSFQKKEMPNANEVEEQAKWPHYLLPPTIPPLVQHRVSFGQEILEGLSQCNQLYLKRQATLTRTLSTYRLTVTFRSQQCALLLRLFRPMLMWVPIKMFSCSAYFGKCYAHKVLE